MCLLELSSAFTGLPHGLFVQRGRRPLSKLVTFIPLYMKRVFLLTLSLTAFGLASCATPVTLSYTGHAAGYDYTAAYNKQNGVILAVNQK